MRFARLYLLLLAGLPAGALAQVAAGDLPGDTIWYLHADFDEIRQSDAGKPLVEWFDEEVVVEINEEFGLRFEHEFDSVTAFADSNLGTVIVAEGPLSDELRNTVMTKVRQEAFVTNLVHSKKDYYFIGDEDADRDDKDDPFEDFEDSIYFSFAVDNKLIVASHEKQMQEMLDGGGRIAGSGAVDGTMFVLTADKTFVQAGMKPDGIVDEDEDGWESNIIRNTEEVSLLVSDKEGQIAIQAQLRSTDPGMAQSIGGIVNGLISLQAFNSELGPEIQTLIRNTRVTVEGNVLSVSTVVDPELAADIVD